MTNAKDLVRNTCLWKFLNTKPGKYVKFFIMLILDLINVIVDWYFYAKGKKQHFNSMITKQNINQKILN